ncbi:MAG: hypothetical protein JXR05_09345 [Flavobacteriaceae bacterium]
MNGKSELPYEYGFARIGSVMNYLTRDFHPLRHAFDMSKLNALGMLVTKQPKGKLTIDANSFTKSTQESSSFSTNSKARAGFPFFKSSIEHHNTQSGAKLNTANGLSLKVRHSLIGYDIVLNDDITSKQLYACATPKFKAAYNRLVTAHKKYVEAEKEKKKFLKELGIIKDETLEELANAYFDFQLEFGHGFITKLKLISTASGELHVSYQSGVEQDEKKYGEGASMTIGKLRKSVGASNAQDWVKAHSQSKSGGIVTAQVESIPGISRVADWANAFISEYAGKGIGSIEEKPPTSISAPTTEAKAPEIPSIDPPKVAKEDLPTPSITLSSADEVVEFMRMKEMKANGNEVSWKKFSEKFKEDADKAGPEEIVKEVIKNQDNDPGNKSQKRNNSDLKKSPTLKTKINLGQKTQNETSGDISLGEYDVLDFEFTNYADYFPGIIPKSIFPTRSGLNIAKINMYLMTRQLIGSYFNYISQLPASITRGYINPDRAASYEQTLHEYSDFINNYIKSTRYITDDDFKACTAEFDQMLEANTTFAKIGMSVYHYFNKNYETFSKSAFGFMLTVNYDNSPKERTRFYAERYKSEGEETSNYKNIITKGHISPATENLMSPWRGIKDDYQAIAKDSVRFMPIIHGGEKPYVALATYLSEKDNENSGWAVLGYLNTDDKDDYRVYGGDGVTTTLMSVKTLEEESEAHCERFHLVNYDNKFSSFYAKFDTDSVNPHDKTLSLLAFYKIDNDKEKKMVSIGGYTTKTDGIFFNGHITADFIPVDYDLVGEGSITGIPMWQDFPFDLMKATITAGYDELGVQETNSK